VNLGALSLHGAPSPGMEPVRAPPSSRLAMLSALTRAPVGSPMSVAMVAREARSSRRPSRG